MLTPAQQLATQDQFVAYGISRLELQELADTTLAKAVPRILTGSLCPLLAFAEALDTRGGQGWLCRNCRSASSPERQQARRLPQGYTHLYRALLNPCLARSIGILLQMRDASCSTLTPSTSSILQTMASSKDQWPSPHLAPRHRIVGPRVV